MRISLHIVAWIAPLIVVAIAVPLAVGSVPPNAAYGFRTQKTLSSPEIWYLANRFSGFCLATAGVLALLVNLTLLRRGGPEQKLLMRMAISLAGFVLIAVAASLIYLRSL